MNYPGKSFYPLISEISLILGIWLSLKGNILYVQAGLMPYFLVVFIVPNTIAVPLAFINKFQVATTYLLLVSIVFALLAAWAFALSAEFSILPLYLIPILASFYYITKNDRLWVSRASIFIASFLILALVSTLLRFIVSNAPFPFTVTSINNDELPQGIPLLFQDALVMITNEYVLTVSIQFLFVILLAASLLSENFILIYTNLRKYAGGIRSSITGSLAFVLGCQCETIIYTVPVFSAILVSLILIPLMAAGIVLLILSNIFLRGLSRMRGNRMQKIADSFNSRKTAITTGIGMLILILVSTLGVLFSWELDIFYFYGLNFLVFAASYVLVSGLFRKEVIQGKARFTAISEIVLSMGIMIAWLIPYMEAIAYQNYAVFGIMELSSFAGGSMLALGNREMNKIQKNLVLEMVSMMFTLAGVFVLYYTDLFQPTLWYGFTIPDQLLFAVLLIMISLPFLWFFNYASIEMKCNANAATA